MWRYFTDNPPLTSAGHLRRLEAAQAVAPTEVQRLASESWRTATFKPADEQEFLNKYGAQLTPDDNVARFDRILREGRPQVAKDILSKLPPAYQPLANARLAMATRAADTVQILRGVAPAQLDTPAIRFERLQWLRRTGNLGEAKAMLVAPATGQTDAWLSEQQQVARDLLAAGHPADAYAVIVQHGQTRGLAFAEAEFLAGWIALRHLKKPADGIKHFQILYDGVSTDISKSRAAYWMGRAIEASGKPKEANEWYGRAAGYGQTFYGQLAARKLPGGAARMPGDPSVSDADRLALGGRELVTVARYLGQAGAYDRTQPFLLKLARLVNGPGETQLLTQFATELKRPDIAVAIARRATELRHHAVRRLLPRRRSRQHRLDRARAGAGRDAPGERLQFCRRLALGRARADAADARHGARSRGQDRRPLYPGQAHARPRLQCQPRHAVSGRHAAEIRRLLRAGARRLQCRARQGGTLARSRSAIRVPARSTWSTGSR